jgi:hypothetical protein
MAGHEGSPGTLRSGQQAGPVARAPGLDADATEVLGALIQLLGREPREPVTVETIAATCAAPRPFLRARQMCCYVAAGSGRRRGWRGLA